MNSWIKVSDRLPDEGADILLAGLYNGEMKSDVGFYYTCSGGGDGGWNCYDYLDEVTHWMPLPEPPQD